MAMGYWSSSKLADTIRGVKKPRSATREGWSNWEEKAKTQHPFRYWLAEDGLDAIQTVLTSPILLFREIRGYFRNRFVLRTHLLTSNLEKGRYHDLDTRILHAIFDELVNLVEKELSLQDSFVADEIDGESEEPLTYLRWASGLTHGLEDGMAPEDPRYGKPTAQAIASQEVIALYTWWKYDRPQRPDPYSFFSNTHKDAEEYRERTDEQFKTGLQIEEKYFEEDQEMLVRLIQIRSHLWC